MYVDVPQFLRCCICVPLRHGLLTWGYIKLAANIILVVFLSVTAVYKEVHHDMVLILAGMITATVFDMIFNIAFVVGSHMKNCRILKVYYYYGIVGLAVLIILSLFYVGSDLDLVVSHWEAYKEEIGHFFMMSAIGLAGIILVILLQFYIILLVRSEIFKLESERSIKFVNLNVTTREDACAMSADDKELLEKVKYDRLQEDKV